MDDAERAARDAWTCATKIAAIGKRVLLVHGSDGVGRDSFITEQMMPLLEKPDHFFAFLRAADGPILPRGSALESVAAALEDLTPGGASRIGPQGRAIPLPRDGWPMHLPADHGTGGRDEAAVRVFSQIRALTRVVPDTIVIVISETGAGGSRNSALLGLLRRVGQSQIDAKIIVSADPGTYDALRHALAEDDPEGSYTTDHRIQDR